MFPFLSLSQLNNIPAIKSPATISTNRRGVNQSIINATWYNAKALELNMYANLFLDLKMRNL